jgi:hypothetical protein
MPKNHPTSARTATLTIPITPRLLYLAKIAARYQDLKLLNFIENAITDALAPERVNTDEPRVDEDLPLWGEGLWDEDEATRMFMLAVTHPTLLNGPQRNLWTLLSGSILANKRSLNLKTFREYYNNPAIDTKHLQVEEE